MNFKLVYFYLENNRLEMIWSKLWTFFSILHVPQIDSFRDIVLFAQLYTGFPALVILRKGIIRLVCNKPFSVHTNVLFNECKILKLSEINTFCVSVYMHKNINKSKLIGTHDREDLRNMRKNKYLKPEYLSYWIFLVWAGSKFWILRRSHVLSKKPVLHTTVSVP